MLSLPQSCFGRASGRGRRLKRRRGAGKPRAASTRRFREDAGIVTRRRGRCRAGDRRSAGAGTAVSGKGQGGYRDVAAGLDRKSVGEGEGVSVRVDLGGGRYMKKKKK